LHSTREQFTRRNSAPGTKSGLENFFWQTTQLNGSAMIRKLASGQYRLYSRKKNPRTGKRRNLGTFASRAAAEKHERAVQYFRH
jgi:hypothetical protein